MPEKRHCPHKVYKSWGAAVNRMQHPPRNDLEDYPERRMVGGTGLEPVTSVRKPQRAKSQR